MELLKSLQRPRQLIWEFTECERHKIIECGVEMMLQYNSDHMTKKTPTTNETTEDKATTNPDEFCFMLTDRSSYTLVCHLKCKTVLAT